MDQERLMEILCTLASWGNFAKGPTSNVALLLQISTVNEQIQRCSIDALSEKRVFKEIGEQ